MAKLQLRQWTNKRVVTKHLYIVTELGLETNNTCILPMRLQVAGRYV